MNIFFWRADNGGSGYYRMLLPSTYLDTRTENTCYCKLHITSEDFKWADIVVIQRRSSKHVLQLIKEHKKTTKFVYELDDDIWNIPYGNPSKEIWEKNIKDAEAIIKECHASIVTNKHLGNIVGRVSGKKVFRIPNLVELPSINKSTEIKNSKITIVWAGSESHCVDFEDFFVGALHEIKKIHGNKIELVTMGYAPKGLGDITTTHVEWQTPFQYLEIMNLLKADIGLIPNANNIFNKSKSNLKFIEYTVSGMLSIMSDSYNDESIGVRIGKTQWFDGLNLVIKNLDWYREVYYQRAMDLVKEKYLIEKNIENIENVFKHIYTY